MFEALSEGQKEYNERVQQILKAAAWTGFRRARSVWYSDTRRNPYGSPSLAFEWDSINRLLESRKAIPAIIEKDQDGLTLWSTGLGPLWTPAGATQHFVRMLVSEMHARVYDFSPKRLNGATVVDAGANIGAFSRWVLKNGARRLMCFEPSPITAKCLRKNLAAEIADGRAEVFEMGLWDRAETLSFDSGNEANPGGHRITKDGSVQIRVVPLDEVVGQEKVDCIKMDIEGAEARALAGARNTVLRCSPEIAVATEHTDDMLGNSRAVIAAITNISPAYSYRVTEAHPQPDRRGRIVMTPYSLFFTAPH